MTPALQHQAVEVAMLTHLIICPTAGARSLDMNEPKLDSSLAAPYMTAAVYTIGSLTAA